MLHQYAAGDIASDTALTYDIGDLSGIQLGEPVPELVYGYVYEAVDVAPRVFSGSTDIQQGRAAITRELRQIVPEILAQSVIFYIVYHEACHVDGILG